MHHVLFLDTTKMKLHLMFKTHKLVFIIRILYIYGLCPHQFFYASRQRFVLCPEYVLCINVINTPFSGKKNTVFFSFEILLNEFQEINALIFHSFQFVRMEYIKYFPISDVIN